MVHLAMMFSKLVLSGRQQHSDRLTFMRCQVEDTGLYIHLRSIGLHESIFNLP